MPSRVGDGCPSTIDDGKFSTGEGVRLGCGGGCGFAGAIGRFWRSMEAVLRQMLASSKERERQQVLVVRFEEKKKREKGERC